MVFSFPSQSTVGGLTQNEAEVKESWNEEWYKATLTVAVMKQIREIIRLDNKWFYLNANDTAFTYGRF
jgi:hypothetical protein